MYGDGVRAYFKWCDRNGQTPALDRDLIKNWVAGLLDSGIEAATARSRQLSMCHVSAWLEEEGEIDTDPLLGLKAPKLDTKVTKSLTDDEVRHQSRRARGPTCATATRQSCA